MYLSEWLNASGFDARYFIFWAIDGMSSRTLMCNIESLEGAKSWILGAPITTGTAPAKLHNEKRNCKLHAPMTTISAEAYAAEKVQILNNISFKLVMDGHL